MDRNDFFTKVNVPTFDSNYASSFEQFVETINNNFTRIASLPFLKGDNGSSIIIHKEKLYDENNKFTKFGILFVKAIYKELAGKTFGNFDELKNVLKTVYPNSEPVNSVYSCEQLNPKKTTYIPVYHDQYTGEKHLCVPYIFQDSRKTVLQGNYLSTYVDQTKYVIGDSHKKEEGVFSWRFETSDFIPSLYYDEDNSMYCWSINGEKSGITAQGVKGEDGNSSKAWLCKGQISDNYDDYIEITEVFKDTYDSVEQNVGKSGIMEGDLAVVAFSNSEENDILFGPVIIATGVQVDYLVKISGNNLLSIKNHNDFHALMKSTGASIQNPESGLNDVLGLYTFGRTKELQTKANGGSSRIPHMFWVDEEENTAHIAPVTVDDDSNNPKREHLDIPDSTIKLGYDSLETNNTSISKHNFNKQFDITNSNYVIVPSTNIKVNNFKGVSMIQTGSLNNTRTAKTVNMSIDLPSLGIKTSSGEIICIDKIRHLIGNSTKPLDISLELTELNCNWSSNDNTSWGGRSYYDVDLFASSATFNENESQAVYVGTTETPIKVTIESRDYFANLQISAIRYDVAFDDENRPLNVRGFYELTGKDIPVKTSDLVYNSGMLLECIKQVGEEFEHTYEPSNNLKITCSTTVSSIKTYTDVIIYLKPYSNSRTNDLFYLLNPGITTPDFEYVFWEQINNSFRAFFDTSYYACLRLRFKDEEDGKLVLSHLNDNGNLPFDLTTLDPTDTENQITDIIDEKNTIKIGSEKINYEFDCVSKNVFNTSYEITDGYGITYDGVSKFSLDGNNISKITQDIKVNSSNKVTIKYLNQDNEVVQSPLLGVFAGTNPPSGNEKDSFKDEFKEGAGVLYWFSLPTNYNKNYYGEMPIFGIQTSDSTTKKFYFFGTHLNNTDYQITKDTTIGPVGINNNYYHILKSSKHFILSAPNNTQSLGGLGISSSTNATNIYSTKFNDFKWNIGVCNNGSVEYRSGIGCGKLLPFPKREQNNVQKGIQHSVLNNSPWYLTLSKNVSSTLFENVYTDFVFDKSNNVILSNNYVERLLPNNVNCYYLGDLYLNNEPILTNTTTKFVIQEFSRDNESNSNTNNPGTQNPPNENIPELPEYPETPSQPINPGQTPGFNSGTDIIQ